ncbi:hypothetical protein [Deinococcus humi]|uniref:Uncharacterized protein n=1 Tax=Deinococcus humi TaxID=662880 RepID=A0A7W8K065_9DEIO|nr:hypothetical protein [Deinococcus humi]MBB5366068.1 hypothetical protein [Deinococcus humi]GGO40019.1 hypothetical protein GCM10008949_48960 [Deinococcus humi]
MSLVRHGAERLCDALWWMLAKLPMLVKLLKIPSPHQARLEVKVSGTELSANIAKHRSTDVLPHKLDGRRRAESH